MKAIWIAAVAAGALLLSMNTAEAGPRYGFSFSFGHGGGYHGHHHGHHYGHHYSPHYYGGGHCTPTYHRPYVVRTSVVNRCREHRTGYHRCGRPYTYYVTVVTYRDHYSNGSCRTYTRAHY